MRSVYHPFGVLETVFLMLGCILGYHWYMLLADGLRCDAVGSSAARQALLRVRQSGVAALLQLFLLWKEAAFRRYEVDAARQIHCPDCMEAGDAKR